MSWLTWWKKEEKKDNQEENDKLPNYKVTYLNNRIWTDTNFNQGYINNAFGPFDAGPVLPVRKHSFIGALLYVDTLKSWDSAKNISNITMTFTRIRIENGSTLIVQEFKTYGGKYLREYTNDSYSSIRKESAVEGSLNVTLKCDNLFYSGDTLESENIFDNENQKIIMTGLVTQNEYSFTNKDNVNIDKTFIIGKFKSGMQTDLVVSGEIPVWFYDKFLPLSTNGYVGSNGDKVNPAMGFHIGAVNDSFYQTINSSINFGRRKDINLDYFDRFYVKNVTISIYYKSEIERRNIFKYWTNKKEQISTITYLTDPEADDIYDIKKTDSNTNYVLTVCFNPQTENDFLDKYIIEENGNNILEFDVRTTSVLNEKVKDLKNYNYTYNNNMIIVDEMIFETNGSIFTIECCSKQINGIRIICTTGNIECMKYPNYKITNLYCINTSNLDLNNELPEIELTLLNDLTKDNLYLTNLKKNGATNTNLLLEGDITSLYEYLPLKRSDYPEGYPAILKGVNTINDSPVPDEYLDANISMCLIDIEDANDINISKFGTTENGEFKQNVFISLIIAYRSEAIIQKLTNSGLKSRNQVITHGEILGDDEIVYADTQYRFGNPNLVQSVTTSGEDEYSAIRLNFVNQYDSGFLDSELVQDDNDDWNLIIDLNNKPTNPNDPNSPSTSDQFRSMINDNDSNNSLLLYVERMETTKNLYFFSTNKTIKNIKVYYYDENGEYVSDPWTLVKTSENFKTKVSEMYWANVDYNILVPENNYFINEETIWVPKYYRNYINIIDNLYTTGQAIDRNSTDEDPKEIRAQKINLFVNGFIDPWLFKEVLPLKVEVKEDNVTKINYKFINMENGKVYSAETGATDDLQIIGINDKPNIKNVLFPTVGQTFGNFFYTGSSINLSSISNGTAVANTSAFNRMFIGNDKIFFVNKVTLLERFKEKINIDGVFQYYEGEPTEAKNCVYNAEDPGSSGFTYINDWALKLPECYESCDVNGIKLTVNFDEYLQLDDNYLMYNLKNNPTYELDLSMKTDLDLSNVIDLDLNLDTLKFIKKGDMNAHLITGHAVNIIFNKNGFLEKKENVNIFKQNIKNCYLIYGDYVIKNNTYLITPLSTMLNNDGYITFDSYFHTDPNVSVKNLKCTNTCQITLTFINLSKQEFNLLISGDVTDWVNKHFKDSDKILPIMLRNGVDKQTENGEYELECEILSTDYTGDDCFKVTSINDMPAPGIGIANSDPDDQCTLNLEEFINPPEEEP